MVARRSRRIVVDECSNMRKSIGSAVHPFAPAKGGARSGCRSNLSWLSLVCVALAFYPGLADGFFVSNAAGVSSGVLLRQRCGAAPPGFLSAATLHQDGDRTIRMGFLSGIQNAGRGLKVKLVEPEFAARAPFVFLAFSIAAMTTVIMSSPASFEVFFDKGMLAPFAPNFLPAFLCFGGGDMAAQAANIRHGKQKGTNLWRMVSAGIVGMVCNAIGTVTWLHFLNQLMPIGSIGLSTPLKLVRLASKAWVHNLAWGTMSNTISLFLRRILAGDHPIAAAHFWHAKILPVTFNNFKFWPLVMFLNFAFVPSCYQVRVTAFAAFCFNTYMSLVANSEPKPMATTVPGAAPLGPPAAAGGEATVSILLSEERGS